MNLIGIRGGMDDIKKRNEIVDLNAGSNQAKY